MGPNNNGYYRPYTDGLGVPNISHPNSSKSSVVSDGGEQQAQKVRHDREAAASPRTPESIFKLDQSDHSLPANERRFELQRKILNSFINTRNYDNHPQVFLPQEALHGLINHVSVTRELHRELGRFRSQAEIDSCARKVCADHEVYRDAKFKMKSFRKIFALLVLSNAVSSIERFLEEDVSDLDLPLEPVGSQDTDGLCRRDESGSATRSPLRCFQGPEWSPVDITHFLAYQWRMLSPFFAQSKKGGVKHYLLKKQHILPFPDNDNNANNKDVKDHQRTTKVGGYGKVFMVRIHPEHHSFSNPTLCERGFAIKQQLEEDHRHVFEKEIAVLKKFSGSQSHDHIVSLLVTFEQFSKLHLVFYRAEGDLAAYWSDIEPQPRRTHANVEWMLEQCAGLTDALLRLHVHLTFTEGPRDKKGKSELLEKMQGM